MNKSGSDKALSKFFNLYGGILIVLAVFVVLFTITTKTFMRPNNLLLVIRQASTSCLIAFGVTCVLIAGSIDLSVGSVYGISGVITALLFSKHNASIPVMILAAIAIGLIFGMINAFIITKIQIMPFIATLGTSYVARGLAYILTGGVATSVMDPKLNNIGVGTVFKIPVTIIYAVLVMIVLSLFMGRTKTGRYIYARGSNPTAAKFAGIKTERMLYIVHSIAAVLAALTGFVNICRLFTATPGMGEGSEIDAIAAVVIGGTSMAGGSGTMFGTLIGAMIIAVMGNGMNHLGMNAYWQQVMKGLLIVVAVGIDGFKKRTEIKRMMAASK